MSKAPKKIWIHDGFWLSGDSSYWSTDEKESEEDTQYIRADLVDELVEALEGMMEVNKELTFSLFIRGVSLGDSRVDQARAALKALEEE